jgi:bacterioferritin
LRPSARCVRRTSSSFQAARLILHGHATRHWRFAASRVHHAAAGGAAAKADAAGTSLAASGDPQRFFASVSTRKKPRGAGMSKKPFVSDIQKIRERARRHIEQGAITDGYGADRDSVVRLLNEALATEIVCTLRYKRHYFMANGIHAKSVAEEFLEHAAEEQEHADKIAKRIVQLGGAPDLSPAGLQARSHSEYSEGSDLVDMLEEDLIAERIAIDTYREIVQYLGNDDPTTRRMMEEILAKEEEHAEDLSSLLKELGKVGEPAKKIEPRAA